jgi:hypothetical protein
MALGHDDVTYVYDDVTYVYDDVTYVLMALGRDYQQQIPRSGH